MWQPEKMQQVEDGLAGCWKTRPVDGLTRDPLDGFHDLTEGSVSFVCVFATSAESDDGGNEGEGPDEDGSAVMSAAGWGTAVVVVVVVDDGVDGGGAEVFVCAAGAQWTFGRRCIVVAVAMAPV